MITIETWFCHIPPHLHPRWSASGLCRRWHTTLQGDKRDCYERAQTAGESTPGNPFHPPLPPLLLLTLSPCLYFCLSSSLFFFIPLSFNTCQISPRGIQILYPSSQEMKRCAISSWPIIRSMCAVALWPESYINGLLFLPTPHGAVRPHKGPSVLTMSDKGARGGWRGLCIHWNEPQQ